jgi:hypothetical protein
MFSNYTIKQIVQVIRKYWVTVHPFAKPYLDAMECLDTINDNYIADTGRSVVIYFLSNATTFKGDIAREVKKELNKRIKEK